MSARGKGKQGMICAWILPSIVNIWSLMTILCVCLELVAVKMPNVCSSGTLASLYWLLLVASRHTNQKRRQRK